VVKIIAEEIEAEAKSELGNYQPATGPFDAWDPLAESTKADRVRQGYSEDDPLERSGELRESIEHEVVGLAAIIGTKSKVGYWQEVGTPKMSPRSFMGPAYIRKLERLHEEIGRCIMRGFKAE
jgi:hypothetical protein